MKYMKITIPEWDVFALLGITDKKMQKKLLPIIRKRLNKGEDRVNVFVYVVKLMMWDKSPRMKYMKKLT